MAHNIYKKMVYSFNVPMWHNITEPSTTPMSAEEILNSRFEGAFSVGLRPITVTLNGEQVETGDFAIVREKSVAEPVEKVFGYCSDRYTPLQPREVAQSYDNNVCEPAETMAFLGEGEEMFISWKMPSFDVRVGDSVDMYGIIRTGFDTLKGARLFTSIYRPVCANTITLAENWAKRNSDGQGKGQIWKGKATNKKLIDELGYWMKHVQTRALNEASLLQSFFGTLSKTPIKNDAEAKEILFDAYPVIDDYSKSYPVELVDKKAKSIKEINDANEYIRDGIFTLFSGQGTEITPDYWGMLNSTTEFFCHYQPSKRPIAESVMFGSRQKNSMQMVKVLASRV